MVADAVLVDILVDLGLPRKLLGELEGFPDGAGVVATTTDIVDFARARGFDELLDEASYIMGMDVVTDLLAFVSEDLVFSSFQVALHEVREETMQFDSGVIGAGEAASSQAAGGHSEIATVFLDHDVGGYFGSSEEGMLRLVDGKVFGNAVFVGRIVVVPASFEFFEFDSIRSVTVDLVGRHVDEGRFGTGLPSSFE